MSFPRYPKYKVSGVEWLGEVPAHWGVGRLKQFADIAMGQSPSSEDCNVDGEGLPFLQGNADFGDHFPSPRTYCPVATKITAPGDVLLSVRAPVGAINIADQAYGIGRGLCAIRATNASEPAYLRYALEAARPELYSVATGSTYDSVSTQQVGDVTWLAPPKPEQNTIAAFLDRETAKIDELVAEQQRLMELLKEKRQAVISHAVTKGLNPDAPMKPSGVEWLGEVPAHWEVERIAAMFCEIADPGCDDLPILSVSIHDGVSDAELSDDEFDRKVTRSEDRSKYKRVAQGDLVYNMMRAWQGAFGTVAVEGMVSPAYVVARPVGNLHALYVEHVLRTPQAVEQMRRHSRGITDFRLRLYWDAFKNLRMPIPPKAEAERICASIAEMDGRFTALADACERSIELLHHRRSALISAAVTGQIDVRKLATAEAA